jgi:hypothetical protein
MAVTLLSVTHTFVHAAYGVSCFFFPRQRVQTRRESWKRFRFCELERTQKKSVRKGKQLFFYLADCMAHSFVDLDLTSTSLRRNTRENMSSVLSPVCITVILFSKCLYCMTKRISLKVWCEVESNWGTELELSSTDGRSPRLK